MNPHRPPKKKINKKNPFPKFFFGSPEKKIKRRKNEIFSTPVPRPLICIPPSKNGVQILCPKLLLKMAFKMVVKDGVPKWPPKI